VAEWERLGPVEEPVIVDCQAIDAGAMRVGEVAAACGQAAYAFIEQGFGPRSQADSRGGDAAPVHKQALRLAGVPHPGHTGDFHRLTGARRSCMMLHAEC